MSTTLTHDCSVAGRVTLTATWKDDGKVYRTECGDCGDVLYAERRGGVAYRIN